MTTVCSIFLYCNVFILIWVCQEISSLQEEMEHREKHAKVPRSVKFLGHKFTLQSATGRNPYCEICLSTIWRLVQRYRRCSCELSLCVGLHREWFLEGRRKTMITYQFLELLTGKYNIVNLLMLELTIMHSVAVCGLRSHEKCMKMVKRYCAGAKANDQLFKKVAPFSF